MPSVRDEFTDALHLLVDKIREDRSVLAAILCGSLSHDEVWAKSDIDLVLVTVDDRKNEESSIALFASGVNVHASLVPRAQFRRVAEGALRNSFMHSLLAKGRLIYTHDESIAELFAKLHEIGERDTQVQVLHNSAAALACIYKAHKWFLTRGDLEYTALWILYAATPMARIEIMSRQLLADREVIPQALVLNPAFFGTIYSDLLNTKKTQKNIRAALDALDAYMAERAAVMFAPIIDHLREVREARSCSEIENHFARNFGISGVTTACEYLADQGLIGKAGIPGKLTRRSNIEVQELAFFYLGSDADDA